MKALNHFANDAASAIERVSLGDRLRTAEQRYRQLAENAPDIVFRYEIYPQPGFTYVNPVVEATTGYSADEHYSCSDVGLRSVHADDYDLMGSLFQGRFSGAHTVALRHVHREGKLIWLEHRAMLFHDQNGRVVAIEGIARDITERRSLEDQLRQSQKMEAIGLLAGGVAHDFNNLLTIINGYSEVILNDYNPSEHIAEKVDQIKRAGEQAAALTSKLLAFSRKRVSQPRAANPNIAIENSSQILRRIIGEDIELVVTLQPGLGSIRVDPNQLDQILMNLVVNARDAMPDGGRLTIETRDEGQWVVLTVRDSGCGMDAATKSRAFEPFFTTKECGRGTGLGLSIVYGAVTECGGRIRIVSEPGEGAAFEISLPRVGEELFALPEEAIPIPPLARSETILVVEDDEAIRAFIATVLAKAGYEVLHAGDGEEALNIMRKHHGQIELLLTDIVMPRMGGMKLLETARAQGYGSKVVFMSGYSEESFRTDGRLDSAILQLNKPFSINQLLGTVYTALASGRRVA
jgi:PAS domain S-box-containing protein